MYKKHALLLIVVAFIGCNVFGQKKLNLDDKIPVDPKVRVGKLDNGLTYYIRENKKPEKRAQFQLAVNAGSILEDSIQQGLAHFTEHMAFNGTKYFKGGDMINILQKNGITFGSHVNAYTSFDQTVYEVTIPTDKDSTIELGFKVLDGWAFGLLMDAKEIDAERGVIIEEWRTRLGADERLRDATWPIMLKNSLYAKRLPIGTVDVLKTFKYETIRNFYKEWYRPDLMAIILVGDFDAAQMEAKVKQYFSGYAKPVNPKERKYFDVPANKEPLIAIATDKEESSTQLQFFWKQPHFAVKTVGDYRTQLIHNLFTGMLNDRLSELAQKPDCPFMGAGTFYGGFLSRSLDVFGGSCSPKDNKVEDALKAVLREIYRVKQHGFLATELERQKEEILSSYEKAAKEAGKTDNSKFSHEYVNNFLEQEPIPGIKTELQYAQTFLDGITLKEVDELVNQWISDDNFVLTLTGPKKDGVNIPNEKTILSILDAAKKEQTQPYVDNFKPEPLVAENLTAGTIVSTKPNTEFGYTEYTLNNGVKFVVKSTDFKEDEIRINAYSPGGTSLYGDDKFFAASQAATIIDQSGISTFDNTQLSKKLKGKNIGISPYINELTEGFSGNCSPKDLETALQLIYLYFKAPRKDTEAFNKYISQLKNQIKNIDANPQVAYSEGVTKALYPDSKRKIVVPTEAQINGLNLDEIYNIYKDRFADASDFTFFFVGNVADSSIKTITKYLSNLPSINRKENWMYRDTAIVRGVVNKDVIKGTEDMSILGVFLLRNFEFDNAKERMAVNILSDALQITLTQVVREKMGGAYSPYIGLRAEKYPTGKLTGQAIIQCQPKNIDAITKAIFKIMKQYQKKGADAETLDKVKKQTISEREPEMKQNGTWVSFLYSKYWYNTQIRSFETFSNDVNAITNEDIKAVAKKYLNTDQYIRVMLKPETVKK